MSEHGDESRVGRLFDGLSGEFMGWSPSAHFLEAYDATVGARLRCAGRSKLRIAELGCGHGTWLKRSLDIARATGATCDALGLDIASERLKLGREYLSSYPEVTLRQASLLSFEPDGAFDLVYVVEVLQYFSLEEQATLLLRWLPHLTAGGALVMIDKDRYSRHALLCETQKLLGRWDVLMGPLRRFGPKHRELWGTIRYPDFRRLAHRLRTAGPNRVQLTRHHEFTSLVVTGSGSREAASNL